jgi:hypothetical protein
VIRAAARSFAGRKDGWTYAVEVRDIVRQILQVTHLSAGIERYGDRRIGVQVVAGTHAAIEVRIAELLSLPGLTIGRGA